MKVAMSLGLLILSLSSPLAAAELQPVTTSGGFQAVAHREIETGSGRKAMVYSVLGSLGIKIGVADIEAADALAVSLGQTEATHGRIGAERVSENIPSETV